MWKGSFFKPTLSILNRFIIPIAAYAAGIISALLVFPETLSSLASTPVLIAVIVFIIGAGGLVFWGQRQHIGFLRALREKETRWNYRYTCMQSAYEKQQETLEDEMHRHAITQKSLKQLYSQLQTILDHIPAIVMIKDLEGAYRFVNQEFERAFHIERRHVLGRTDFDFFSKPYAERMMRHDRQVIGTGGSGEFEERMPQRDGEHVYRVVKCVLSDAYAAMDAVVCIGIDVTDRRRTEDRLRLSHDAFARNQIALAKMLMELRRSHGQLQEAQLQLVEAEKRESIGRLAAGVAHEVKNPLAIMLTAVECLSDYLKDKDERVQQFLGDIQFAVSRADRVVRGLLDFSVTRDFDLIPEKSDQVIDHALNLVKHELVKAHVSLVRDIDPNLPRVFMDRHKIEQVLLNLMINAVHAMKGDGGTLTVKTYLTRMSQASSMQIPSVPDQPEDGPAVIIQIDDTGKGIPEDQIEKIFEPFFTTKSSGEGTGLGLSVCQSIVQLHGGGIRILNRRNGGVRALIMLRAERGRKDGIKSEENSDRGRRGTANAAA